MPIAGRFGAIGRGRPGLSFSTDHQERLRQLLAPGVEAAACALRDGLGAGPQAQLSVRQFASRCFQDFPSPGETPSEEPVIGVLVRLTGPLPGAGLFAVGSEATLARGISQQNASGQKAAEDLLSLGGAVLKAFAAHAISTLLERSAPPEVANASLVSASRTAILLGTHAPGDTVLVSMEIDLVAEPESEPLAVFIDFLLEPKRITERLG